MISSEMPEILGKRAHIGVMRGGRLAGVVARAEATQASLLVLASAVGGLDDEAGPP
jgi:ABC-type sugar transport system ATPase subunit